MARRDLDKELEALRRLPSNKECPSCSATAQFGFRDVCTKFAAFVCSDCKAAHQARARERVQARFPFRKQALHRDMRPTPLRSCVHAASSRRPSRTAASRWA